MAYVKNFLKDYYNAIPVHIPSLPHFINKEPKWFFSVINFFWMAIHYISTTIYFPFYIIFEKLIPATPYLNKGMKWVLKNDDYLWNEVFGLKWLNDIRTSL